MIENASISKVIYKDGKYTVESVNDTSYIKE
jgi:probable phosphoglycerate mutase